MKQWTQIVGAFAALAIASAAHAQDYPNREIKMIVPFPPAVRVTSWRVSQGTA